MPKLVRDDWCDLISAIWPGVGGDHQKRAADVGVGEVAVGEPPIGLAGAVYDKDCGGPVGVAGAAQAIIGTVSLLEIVRGGEAHVFICVTNPLAFGAEIMLDRFIA